MKIHARNDLSTLISDGQLYWAGDNRKYPLGNIGQQSTSFQTNSVPKFPAKLFSIALGEEHSVVRSINGHVYGAGKRSNIFSTQEHFADHIRREPLTDFHNITTRSGYEVSPFTECGPHQSVIIWQRGAEKVFSAAWGLDSYNVQLFDNGFDDIKTFQRLVFSDEVNIISTAFNQEQIVYVIQVGTQYQLWSQNNYLDQAHSNEITYPPGLMAKLQIERFNPAIRPIIALFSGKMLLAQNNELFSLNSGTTLVREKSFEHNIVAIECGAEHLLVLLGNGSLYAKGCNQYGQLGAPEFGHELAQFKKVDHIKDVTQVSCGRHHTLVLANDIVYSAGKNHKGQLGLGRISERETHFQEVSIAPIAPEKACSIQ